MLRSLAFPPMPHVFSSLSMSTVAVDGVERPREIERCYQNNLAVVHCGSDFIDELDQCCLGAVLRSKAVLELR